VFPLVVAEFSEVISPCDIKVTVDLVAAEAGASAPADRPTATSAVAAAAAMARNARFTFISISPLNEDQSGGALPFRSVDQPYGPRAKKA
jgi:hypothetical protein